MALSSYQVPSEPRRDGVDTLDQRRLDTAPEQAADHSAAVGPATGVYALGAILYELLTGRPSFKGDTTLATLDQLRLQAPTPPSQFRPGVPLKLEAICLQCLAKDPARRFPTVEALAQALLEAHPC
jgi:serine/threonine protein kinase